MAEKPKNKPTKKTKKLLEELQSQSSMGLAREKYRENRGSGGSRTSALKASVKRYGEVGEAKRTLATGKKGGAEEFFKYAGFENLGALAGSLFDRKATKEEASSARKTLGMKEEEGDDKKESKKEKGTKVDSRKIDYVVNATRQLQSKMDEIYKTVGQIDKNVSYIVDRVAPKLLEAKQEGGEKRKTLQFDPLAPAGEQFRQVSASGKATVAKAPKEYMKSATMKAALMGSMPPQQKATAQVKKFQDPKEKSFTEEFAKEDPIAALREDMNTNFEKVFKILEDQKEQIDGMSSPLSGLGGILPIFSQIGKIIPGLARFLGPAGAVAMAGYIGYEIGDWLNKKFGLSDKLSEGLADVTGLDDAQNKLIGENDKTLEDQNFKINTLIRTTGYKLVAPGVFEDSSGNKITLKDLPEETRSEFARRAKIAKLTGFAASLDVKEEPPSGKRGGRIPAQYERPYGSSEYASSGTESSADEKRGGTIPAQYEQMSPTGKIADSGDTSSPPMMMKSAANGEGGVPNISPTPPKKISNQQGKSSMIKALDKKGVSDPKARAAIMAQVAHESGGFTQLSENLKYSPPRLKQVFSYYKRNPEEAAVDAGNPVAIGSKAYGGRLGNGPAETGDGYEYRGRGFIQLTGKSNYNSFGVNNPDDLLNPDKAAENAVNYMLGYKGDWSDVAGVTKYVNGNAMLGLSERAGYYDSFLSDPEVAQGGEGAFGGDLVPLEGDESTVPPMATGGGGGAVAPVGATDQQDIQSALGSLTSMATGGTGEAAPTATGGTGSISPTGEAAPAAISSATTAMGSISPTKTCDGQGLDVASQVMEMGKASMAAAQAAPTVIMQQAMNQASAQPQPQKTNPLAVLGEIATRTAEGAFQRAISKDFSHPTAFTTIGNI